MNSGQIIMSMMQTVAKPVTTDAALVVLSQDGVQKTAEGVFADLMGVINAQATKNASVDNCAKVPLPSAKAGLFAESSAFVAASKLLGTLQAEVLQSPNAPPIQNQVAVSETESTDVSGNDSVPDGIWNGKMDAADTQMILAAYSQPAIPVTMSVKTENELIEAPLQPVLPTIAAAVSVPAIAADETEPESFKNSSTLLQHPGRTPSVNIPASHDVDAVQNVPAAPKAEQQSIASAAAPKVAFASAREAVEAPASSQMPTSSAEAKAELFAETKLAPPVRQTTAATSLQAPDTLPQHPGRTPIVNIPASHEIDAVQNVPAAPKAEQQSAASAAPKITFATARVAVEAPASSQLLMPSVAVSATKTELAYATDPVAQPQQFVRTTVTNIQSGHTVVLANIPAEAPITEQLSAKSATPPKLQAADLLLAMPQPIVEQESLPTSVVSQEQQLQQTSPKVAQAFDEIDFSLPRPINVSRSHPLESNRVSQTAPVLMSQVMPFDLNQPQNSSAGFGTTSALPEGATSSTVRQDLAKTSTIAIPANSESGLRQKDFPGIAIPGTATETSVVQPETGNVTKGTANIRTASLQETVQHVSAQFAHDARSENGRQSPTVSVAEKNLAFQQNMGPVGEAALTSDDSMSNSGDQAKPDQTFDSQLAAQQIHAQSKSEHQVAGQVSNSRFNVDQHRRDLPEQVVHQVREHLDQHEVKPGNQQITLTLSPENLGELKMNLNLQGQRLTVEIVTENRAVRDAILQHSDSLKDSLARQNISVESFDVTANGRGTDNSGHNQNAWKELERQKQQQFLTSTGGYLPSQVAVTTSPLAYQAKNEHAMLDIHY